jgi:MoxR-like ATPase
MSKAPNKTAEFLKAMNPEGAEPAATPAPAAAPVATLRTAPAPEVQAARRTPKAKTPSRAELKHFGGYLDEETLEKIAVLRVRLKKDNSELIKLAIDDLHRKHNAKRAFGDA